MPGTPTKAISSARAGENARAFLLTTPDLTDELGSLPQEKLGIGARLDAPADETVDLTGIP